jgi:hypothetical protein
MSSLTRGALKGAAPRCHSVACEENGTVWITVGSTAQECIEDGERLEFDGFAGEIECPDPALLCGMKRFMKGNLPIPTLKAMPSMTRRMSPIATASRSPRRDGQPVDWISGVNGALAVGIIAIAAVGLWCLWRMRPRVPAGINETGATERAEPRLEISPVP